MANLWWTWNQYTLDDAAEDIGEVRSAIADNLRASGYSDVADTEDVHGAKGDLFLAVVFLCIGGREFWQAIACGGNGPVPGAQAEVKQVQDMITNLKFP